MTEPIRVAMWAGPRNISTTMMRSFENRPDTTVVDEPFYSYYLTRTGADHPMREACIAALPPTFEGVVALLNGPALEPASVVFHKHIAYHFSAGEELPLDWTDAQRTFLLIRNPRAMVASYARKYDDVAPIVNSLKVQRRIFERLNAKDRRCPVVDAADILKDPEAMLRALCAAIEIPFTEKMLSWPKGRRASDGVWAPHWYDAVEQSTGFRPYVETSVSLTPRLEAIAEACEEDYTMLRLSRILP